MGGHTTCCVVNCKNNGQNSQCKFFTFPRARYRIDQRNKWIAAVKRINPDGSPWSPKISTTICSAHFIGNHTSNDPLNPSYIPTIFPSEYRVRAVNQANKINRHARFIKRKNNKVPPLSTTVKTETLPLPSTAQTEQLLMPATVKTEQIFLPVTIKTEQPYTDEPMNFNTDDTTILRDSETVKSDSLKYADKACQVYIILDCIPPGKTFTCIRYINNNSSRNDVEIQTDITETTRVIIVPSQKKFKNKMVGTPIKTYVDQSAGPNFTNEVTAPSHFVGFSSVKKDDQLLDLAGVTFDNFNFLLKRLSKDSPDSCKITKEDKLFILLLKIKTGLTFPAISALYSVHRTTISRIFFSTLQELSSATENLVFWPLKSVVQATMPQYFHLAYNDTRVVVGCTEFRIEVPASVDNRVETYSHNKKGYTAKVLIGVTPGGFISFKSKVAGGRMSDSQLIIESGLVELLEDGDTVLADKNFADIQQTMDASGKKVALTLDWAKGHAHVERIIQRLKSHQILNKIPSQLFSYVDNIFHICCVLVNLQAPKTNAKTDNNK